MAMEPNGTAADPVAELMNIHCARKPPKRKRFKEAASKSSTTATVAGHPGIKYSHVPLDIEPCSLAKLESHLGNLERELEEVIREKKSEIEHVKGRINYWNSQTKKGVKTGGGSSKKSSSSSSEAKKTKKMKFGDTTEEEVVVKPYKARKKQVFDPSCHHIVVWEKESWPPILQPIYNDLLTGAFAGGKSSEHPCFADTDRVSSPSAEVIQKAIEMNAKYQLTVVGKDGVTKSQKSHNDRFVTVLAIAIAMNTTNPPMVPTKKYEPEHNEKILAHIQHNVRVLYHALNLCMFSPVNDLATKSLKTYYRMYNILREKVTSGVISSWEDTDKLKSSNGRYIHVTHYSVLSPFVLFRNVNFIGERTKAMIDETTGLLVSENREEQANNQHDDIDVDLDMDDDSS